MAGKGKKSEGGRKNSRSSDNRGDRGTSSARGKKKFDGPKSKGKFNPNSKKASSFKTDKPEGEENTEASYAPKKSFGYKKGGRDANGGKVKLTPKPGLKKDDGSIRLNRFIAHAGICSRRDADLLISTGTIRVNGKVITEMGFRVLPTDKVMYEDQTIKNEKLVYYILNKPKNYITTMSDPEKRKTVLELMKGACKERIYPVGRLDRNTSGVLLFSNDGDLAKTLLHPKHLVKKIYQVSLDKSIKQSDFDKIIDGIQLEDGFIKPDELAYTSKENKKELGIEIHSGKNRIVRRIFEELGYKVVRLDRVYFAGLTKKGMSRGQYRELLEDEVSFLKMLG